MAIPFRLKRSAVSGKRPELSDLQLGELALNFYDGYLFATRETNGVGIADTVSLLTPWTENYGGASIFYEQSVGIGTTSPTETLTVFGSAYVSENFNTKTLFSSTITSNNGIFTSFSVSGLSTFSDNVDINAALDVDGHTELDDLNVTGIATIQNLDVQGDFDVYDSQAVFHNDLFVAGNLSIGGTATVITAQDLRVFDKDIVLGITTNASDEDISTDITANHGGIAIASTEGYPLVDLALVGFSTLPATYKQLMWVASNSYGIGTTDAWHFNYAVGIGSTLVPNNIRLAVGGIQLTDNTIVTPQLSVTGVSTFSNNIDINAAIDVDGHTELDELNVSGVSTFSSLVDFNGGVDISGHLEIDNVNISGITTFSDTTDNTLGDADTGAVQIDGGLGVNKNVTVGGNLDVQGYSNFVGVVTFRGGTINIGDADTDDVNIGGEFISSLIPNDDDSYDLGSTSKKWRNIYIDGIAEIDDLNVSGITTTILFNVGVGGTVITTTQTGFVGINSTTPTVTLDVGGTINSNTDVTINGTSVLTSATNDAVALAIALG